MKLLRNCPCFYNHKYSYLYSNNLGDYDEEEDSDSDYSLLTPRSYKGNPNNLININGIDSLKNNWEWLCLKYERRLNEILNIVKNTNNNVNNMLNNNGNNKLGQNDVDVGMFLSFVPNILQDYIRNLINNNKNNFGSGIDLENEDLEGLISNKLIEKKGVMLMFCDITGFTSITNIIEKKNNSKYVANLGRFLNDFFNPLINIINYYNGDIIKFSGDAILTIFYPHTNSNNNNLNDTTSSVDSDNMDNVEHNIKMGLNCLKCCEELHNILNNYPVVLNNNSSSSLTGSSKRSENESPVSNFSRSSNRSNKLVNNTLDNSNIYSNNNNSNKKCDGSCEEVECCDENGGMKKLKLHISCTFGDIKMKMVGGIFERYEYYLNGTPFNELIEINNISKSDETIISENLYNIVKNHIDSVPIESNNNSNNSGKCYYKFVSFKPDVFVDGMISSILSRNLSLRKDSVDFDFGEKKMIFMKLLSYFIPKYIYKKLIYNVNIYNNEIRKITIIFVNFQIHYNYSDDSNKNESSTVYLNNLLVEVIMKICQKSIYSFEGTLNKLLIDDKGLSFLIFMGFPPFFSEDYTFKSVLLSLNIYNNINKYNLNNNLLINHTFGNRNDVTETTTGSSTNLNGTGSEEGMNKDRDRLIHTLSSVKYKINMGVGISTGNVWCGILGNDVRREYTAIGDVVNVSCRLMDYSLKLSKAVDKGYDETTRCKKKNEYFTDNVMVAVKKLNVSETEEINTNRLVVESKDDVIHYTVNKNENTRVDQEHSNKDSNDTNVDSTISNLDGNSSDNDKEDNNQERVEYDEFNYINNLEHNVKIIKDNDIKYNIIMDTNTYKDCNKYIETIKLNPVKLKNKKGLFDIYTTNCRLIFNHFSHSDGTEVDELIDRNSELDSRDSDFNVLDSLFGGERLLKNILGMMKNNNVVYLEHNDSNGNSLLYGYIRRLMGRHFYDNRLVFDDYNFSSTNVDDLDGTTLTDNNNNNFDSEGFGVSSKNREFKVLGINYNVGGIGSENVSNAYRGLVNGIVGEWSRSTERSSNFSCDSSCGQSTDVFDEEEQLLESTKETPAESHGLEANKDNEKRKKLLTKELVENKKDKKNVLKELLDPSLHWNMDVLGNLLEQNLSIDRNDLVVAKENRSNRNSIVSLLLLGDSVDEYKKEFVDSNDAALNNKLLLDAAATSAYDDEEFKNEDEKGNNIAALDNKLLNEKDVDDYLYSLIEGMNLYHNLVLVINVNDIDSKDNRLVVDTSNVDSNNTEIGDSNVINNKLLDKLIRYANGDGNENKFVLLIIDGNFNKDQKISKEKMKLERLNRNQIKNLLFELIGNKLLTNITDEKFENLSEDLEENIDRLKEQQQSQQVVVDKLEEELVTIIYNNTNGIYYFVYLYFKYILDYVSNKENELDGLIKSLGNLYKNEITIYFKYKIDLLNNYELFVLKFLILLNHPINLNKLHDVINFDPVKNIGSNDDNDTNMDSKDNNNNNSNDVADGSSNRSLDDDLKLQQKNVAEEEKIEQREIMFEKEEGLKMILNRLVYHNLVTCEFSETKNNNKLLSATNEQQNLLNSCEENGKKYVVKNKILKEIVNDMIPSEEKLHIVNKYLIHF